MRTFWAIARNSWAGDTALVRRYSRYEDARSEARRLAATDRCECGYVVFEAVGVAVPTPGVEWIEATTDDRPVPVGPLRRDVGEF